MATSASSIVQFKRCQRQWGHERIDGVKAAQSPKAALGTRCHEITEAYLRDGTAPNRSEEMVIEQNGSAKTYYPGRIALNIFHHLPPAGTVPRVEEQLDFNYRGLEFHGFIDWQTDEIIGDHKFTSSLSYAMSANDLVTDVQGVLYRTARWLESDDKKVTLQWTYGDFAAKASRKVVLPVVRDLGPMDLLIPTVEQMLKVKDTVTDARELPKTLSACSMFGGCPHQQWCGVTGLERTRGLMASAALEKLRAQRAAAAAAAGGAPTAPVVETPAAPALTLVAGAINPPGEQVPAEQSPTYVAPVQPTAAGAPAAELKKPRGRPRKDQVTIDTRPLPAQPAVPSAPAPAAASTVANDTEVPAPSKQGIRFLYIDCRPIRRDDAAPLVECESIVDIAHKILCKELEVDHYTFIDFGKGRGALAHAVGATVDALPGERDVVLSTTSPEGRDVMQALIQRARYVVRGAA